MKQQVIIATAIGAVASFLLGWLLWGVLTMDYFNSNLSPVYVGLQKNPAVLWMIFVSQVIWSFLLATLIDRTGSAGVPGGIKTGAFIFFMVESAYIAMTHATLDIYANHTVMVADIALNTVFGALVGGIIGWWLGRNPAGEKQA